MRLAVAAVVALAIATGVAAASNRADAVTLSLRQYTNASKVKVFVWYGQIASQAAGEDVEVLGRECLTSFYRQLIATKTASGGGWEVESASVNPPYYSVFVNSGTTFRARWRDELSDTILYRVPLPSFYAEQIPKRRAWKVTVNPMPIYQVLTGRYVELQRKRGGTWTRYKRARLVRKPTFEYGGATNHEAVFEVPTRGLTLRALVPAKTAAPCYLAKATEPWRS